MAAHSITSDIYPRGPRKILRRIAWQPGGFTQSSHKERSRCQYLRRPRSTSRRDAPL